MSSVLDVLRFGWPYLRRYWTRLVLSIVLCALFAATNASFIWALRTVIGRFDNKPAVVEPAPVKKPSTFPVTLPFADTVKKAGGQIGEAIEPWLPRMGTPLTWRQILGGLLFMPLLVSVRSLTDFFGNYFSGWVSERVVRDLRLDIMAKLNVLSLDFFHRSTTGDLLTRVNGDTASLMRALRQGGTDLVQAPMTLLSVMCYLAYLDWKLTLCAFIILPTCLLPLFVLGKKARRATAANLKAAIKQSSHLVEMIGNIRVVKSFGLEHVQLERFRLSSLKMVHSGMQGTRAKELVNPIIEIISVFGLGVLLIYIFKTGRSGEDLASFLFGAALLSVPIKKMAGLHIIFEQAGVGLDRLKEIMAEVPTVREPEHPKPLPPFSGSLQFENVTFAFGNKTVLRDFNLHVPRGYRLGLAGESGSGKTTILNLLFRFYDPKQGRVLIDGLDLRDISMHDLRKQMALVSQEVVMFDQTVAENIACGKTGATREEVEAAAKAAFAHDFILQLPKGYDTRVGERGMNLSGGQRQRIAIARAFVRNAPILVLDEATASLDSKAEGEVQAVIDRLAEHRTVICVAHRLSTLATMDRILVLTDGRVVEQGSFEELMKARGAFATMANRQGIFAHPVPEV